MDCYSLVKKDNFWKLDKIDKIFISFILIIVTIFNISSCFATTSEYTDVIVNSNGVLNGVSAFGGLHNSNNVDVIYYYKLEPGVEYTLNSYNYPIDETNGSYYYSNSLEIGSQTKALGFGNIRETITFVAEDYQYFLISRRNDGKYTDGNFILTKKVQSKVFNDTINLLLQNVGIAQIWNVFDNSIPFILVVVLFSVGVWFIKHNIIEHSKGRDF